MPISLSDGWFADRATGMGKPVYSTGTTIVPTNGVVGIGVSSAPTAPTFGTAGVSAPKVSLLDAWFCDRATGMGKPVYSSGTTIVPTNGIVGIGVSSAPTAPTFGTPATVGIPLNILDGWFVDRAPGQGKPVYATGTTIVPTNGIVGGGVSPNFVTDLIQIPNGPNFLTAATFNTPPSEGTVDLNWTCQAGQKTPYNADFCQGNKLVWKNTNTCDNPDTSTGDIEQTVPLIWKTGPIPYTAPTPNGYAIAHITSQEAPFGMGEIGNLWTVDSTTYANNGLIFDIPDSSSVTVVMVQQYLFTGRTLQAKGRVYVASGSNNLFESAPYNTSPSAPLCNSTIVTVNQFVIDGTGSVNTTTFVPEDVFGDFFFITATLYITSLGR